MRKIQQPVMYTNTILHIHVQSYKKYRNTQCFNHIKKIKILAFSGKITFSAFFRRKSYTNSLFFCTFAG